MKLKRHEVVHISTPFLVCAGLNEQISETERVTRGETQRERERERLSERERERETQLYKLTHMYLSSSLSDCLTCGLTWLVPDELFL